MSTIPTETSDRPADDEYEKLLDHVIVPSHSSLHERIRTFFASGSWGGGVELGIPPYGSSSNLNIRICPVPKLRERGKSANKVLSRGKCNTNEPPNGTDARMLVILILSFPPCLMYTLDACFRHAVDLTQPRTC